MRAEAAPLRTTSVAPSAAPPAASRQPRKFAPSRGPRLRNHFTGTPMEARRRGPGFPGIPLSMVLVVSSFVSCFLLSPRLRLCIQPPRRPPSRAGVGGAMPQAGRSRERGCTRPVTAAERRRVAAGAGRAPRERLNEDRRGPAHHASAHLLFVGRAAPQPQAIARGQDCITCYVKSAPR